MADELDRRILWCLSDGACLSVTKIAKKVGAPASTVTKRLDKMVEAGVVVKLEGKMGVVRRYGARYRLSDRYLSPSWLRIIWYAFVICSSAFGICLLGFNPFGAGLLMAVPSAWAIYTTLKQLLTERERRVEKAFKQLL